MNPFTRLRGPIALAAAAFFAACAASPGDTGESTSADTATGTTAATSPVAVELSPTELSAVEGIAIGSEDAPVVVYEFADFQCPGCAQVAAAVMPVIKEEYVAPGRVRFVYYDYPLIGIHPHAFLAARAARCAEEQGKFWEYHDILYSSQSQWSAEQSPPVELFVQYAQQVGVDEAQFGECLRSNRYAREVSASMALGQYLGVPGTPTLFVNGRRIELTTLADLRRLLDQELGATVEG